MNVVVNICLEKEKKQNSQKTCHKEEEGTLAVLLTSYSRDCDIDTRVRHLFFPDRILKQILIGILYIYFIVQFR